MNWLAGLFTLAYAAQAALLVLLGAETTPVLRALAVGNALLCALLLWVWCFLLAVRRPRDASRRLSLVAVLLLAPAFFLPSLAGWYERAALAMRTADTELHDVTDEPLYSAGGNVLGIRVGFTLIPPQTGYYSVEPLVLAPPEQQALLRDALRSAGGDETLAGLRSVKRTINPQPTAINARRLAEEVLDRAAGGLYLEEGVAYGFTFELLPAYLQDPRDPLPVRNASNLDGYCVALPRAPEVRAAFDALATPEARRPWRIAVQQTTYGWGDDDEVIATTTEAYAAGTFRQGVRDEGIASCADGP